MAKLFVYPEVQQGHVNPELQGHFSEHLGSCIYEGIFVGENSDIPNVNGMRKDVVEALKEIKVPVLRWPGGCFADEYHWKDGIGPKEKRKKMINTHWGGVVEDNSFGTHEFMELCRQLGCKTYVNGNVGSGTVQEMSEWVEYMTFKGVSPMADQRKENGHEKPWTVDYFGVGNENWGCGGNMRPEYYGDLYRRYQTYVRNYGGNIFFDLRTPKGVIYDLELPNSSLYNVENAVAAAAVVMSLGVDEHQLRYGLKTYEGVRRRFDYRIKTHDLVMIDDYAHHPKEIASCLESVRYLYPGKRVVGIFQPHLYSRTRDFADQFAEVLSTLDELIMLPIYPAREKPILGVTSSMVLRKIDSMSKYLCTPDQVLELVPALCPDVVVTMGAGDIDRLVPRLEKVLKES